MIHLWPVNTDAPNIEQHGGGAPCLQMLSRSEAVEKLVGGIPAAINAKMVELII